MALIFHFECTLKCRQQFVSVLSSGNGLRVVRTYHPFHIDSLASTITRRQNFRLVKLKRIADDILKCISNKKQVPYRVENIVEKRRNCLLQAISLFLTKFSTAIDICSASKSGIVW